MKLIALLNNFFDRFLTARSEKVISFCFSASKVGILLAILPFILLCYYVHPYLDSFALAYLTYEKGPIGLIIDYYFNWMGRYSVLFYFAFLNPLNYGWVNGVKIILLIHIVLFIFSLYFFLKMFLKNSNAKHLFWITLLLSAFFFSFTQEYFSLFYWWSSSACYFFSLTYLLIFFGLFILLNNTTGLYPRTGIIFCLSLFSMLCVGSNEIYALVLLIVFSVYFCSIFINKSKLIGLHLYFFFLIVAEILFLVLAPGNLKRMESYESSGQIFTALFRGGYDTLSFFSNIFCQTPFLFLTLLFIPFGNTMIKKGKVSFLSGMHPVILLSVIIFSIYIFLVFYLYSSGAYTTVGRMMNILFFLFTLSWFYWILCLLSWLIIKNITIPDLPHYVYYLITIIIVFSFAQGNCRLAYVDLLKYAPVYNSEMVERYNAIQNAKQNNQSSIEINTLSVQSRSFTFPNGLSGYTPFQTDSLLLDEMFRYFQFNPENIKIIGKMK